VLSRTWEIEKLSADWLGVRVLRGGLTAKFDGDTESGCLCLPSRHNSSAVVVHIRSTRKTRSIILAIRGLYQGIGTATISIELYIEASYSLSMPRESSASASTTMGCGMHASRHHDCSNQNKKHLSSYSDVTVCKRGCHPDRSSGSLNGSPISQLIMMLHPLTSLKMVMAPRRCIKAGKLCSRQTSSRFPSHLIFYLSLSFTPNHTHSLTTLLHNEILHRPRLHRSFHRCPRSTRQGLGEARHCPPRIPQ
jgi:hypothetical protein